MYSGRLALSWGWRPLNFNPFVPNAPFLYPLKSSENRKVFWCFQGVEKGCIRNEWVKWNWLYKIFFFNVFESFREQLLWIHSVRSCCEQQHGFFFIYLFSCKIVAGRYHQFYQVSFSFVYNISQSPGSNFHWLKWIWVYLRIEYVEDDI